MADLGDAAGEAARTAGAVTQQAANGDIWAFAVVALIAVTVLFGLWIWRGTGRQESRVVSPSDPSCPPGGGQCPEIRVLVVEVQHLTKQIREDRDEWREHRQGIKDDVQRIHERIDDQNKTFATKSEVSGLVRLFEHFTEEATTFLNTLRQYVKPPP
jgi:hypothetical protein